MAQLSDFNFSIVYRPGKKNQYANVMSRYPEQNTDRVTLDKETVRSVCDGSMNPGPVVETIPCKRLNILDVTEDPAQPLAQIDLRELRKQQRDDPIVGVWLRAVVDKFFPKKDIIAHSRDHLTMSRHFDKFVIKRGLLYIKIVENTENIQQLVLPSCYRFYRDFTTQWATLAGRRQQPW